MVSGNSPEWIRLTAVLCAALLTPGNAAWPQQAQAPQGGTSQQAPAAQAAVTIPPDQLDSLVAPIALYPDPLLAQVLAASTYPLEIVQLQQWLTKHKDLKDKALADAVQKESWDPSVQNMAALPDVVKLMVEDIKWTTELGNAFLAQQSDVMAAVQRMRAKAKDKGNLKSNEQVKVETKVVESKQVVVIEQANPQVIYVPSPNPTVVYGPPPPAYPYPPAPSWGYAAAGMAVSFGVGVMMGAFWSGGGWGYNCGWHGGNNDITINNNNNFNRNTNRTTNVGSGNVGNGNRSGQWQHNPQHRGGAPYGDRTTANKFGGTARGDSLSTRQASARQNQGDRNVGANRGANGDRNLGANRGGGDAAGDRNVGANRGGNNDRNAGANRGANNDLAGNRGSDGDRNAGANRGGSNDRNVGANRGGGDAAGDRNVGANRGSSNDRNAGANRGTSSNQIGSRDVSGGNSRGSGAFGAGGNSGRDARSSSSRGSSSMSGSRGGGGGRSRGGGGGRRR